VLTWSLVLANTNYILFTWDHIQADIEKMIQ